MYVVMYCSVIVVCRVFVRYVSSCFVLSQCSVSFVMSFFLCVVRSLCRHVFLYLSSDGFVSLVGSFFLYSVRSFFL